MERVRFSFLFVVVSSLLLAPGLLRAEPLKSNLGLLDQLATGALAEAVEGLKLAPGVPVSVLARTPNNANSFVLKLLAKELASQGHEVRILNAEASGDASEPASAAPPTPSTKADTPRNNEAGQNNSPAYKKAQAKRAAEQAAADSAAAAADSIAAADPLWGHKASSEESEPATEQDPEPGSPPASSRPAEARPPALPPSTGLPPGDLVELEIVEFGVAYTDVSRRMLFGPSRFTRVGGAYFQLSHLKGPDGSLVSVVSSERHGVDRLSGRQRSLVEGASYPFDPPEFRPSSLGRYIEPTIVVGIVGSLIYLFYTNQN